MKIGLVDLDTSHPQNWIPIIRDLGHEVVGVWDGGAVHPREYVVRFTRERDIPCIYEDLAEMATQVDCAIIHGCDWDTHVIKARPFVAAGKSVLLDKPVAGSFADLQQIRSWANDGVRITGGSSLRFCREVQEWLMRPVADRGTPHTALAGCGVDEFNYGIHAYSLLLGMMGPGVRSVRHIGAGPQRRIELQWEDERIALLTVGTAAGVLPFYITLVTEQGVTHVTPDARNLYRALLEAVLPYLAGETNTPPVPINTLLEPELCALAARQSALQGNSTVSLGELTDGVNGYEGAVFAQGYRLMRYPEPLP